MTKRDWVMKSTVAVMLSTSLLMGGQVGVVAAKTQDSKQSEVANIATSLIGKDYEYKAKGPKQFGSAELAAYAYKQVGISIGSTISSLYKTGSKVSEKSVAPGDLVFFASSGSGSPTFMGIYIGSDQFVYSSKGEDEVVVKTYSKYSDKFVGARRVIDSSENTPSKPEQPVSKTADQVIKNGEKYLGTKYKYGSSSSTTSTFDCSSFTQRVFKEAGITLPRDSRQQSTVGKSVSKSNLQKGDLIFMKASVNSTSDRITHVAIYAGNGKILHTYGSPGVTYSKYDGTNWEKRTVKIKRVI
ncbi:C40 family peptidase [Brevibacillus porteri]|uniref:Gamma-glutamyl hydrolase n=1 Tax=Brevibacillus porteri TaxID=2126350 RepID=A0ABX5FIW5_9BACL|nr:C40 family peptidase [Brevibacillus porteri]MED1800126.1 C40 family peptidase [Brevibacillus porteri]MED2134536.1 C40 family peptidase [Brevibacillus porteri]MED2747139.1 C40 family peptidase [Brevibacillus porteri]MED2812497.1 C40 family peptidase [Brevibacillus porteri]MED2896962.1 C40 family peptidase [Brevibacillus porteri]